jgi:CrcB protein
MYSILGVFLGGGIGSVLRWLICCKINSHWGTMIVNIIGAFLIGCAYTYFQKHLVDNTNLKLFVITGLLGGFTTFSTYLLNFTTLIAENNYTEAFLYLLLSIIIGVIALVLGMKCIVVIG